MTLAEQVKSLWRAAQVGADPARPAEEPASAAPQPPLARPVAQTLEALAEDYDQHLAGELARLAGAARALAAPEHPPAQGCDATGSHRPALDLLVGTLHRLGGATGTFGYQRLSQGLQALEQRGLALSSTPAALWPPQGLAGFLADVADVESLDRTLTAPRRAGAANTASSAAPFHAEPRPLIHVIEDDIATGESICLTLANFGYRVQYSSHGAAAEAAVRQAPPDALVVDMSLGEGERDGAEVALRLQALLPEPVPVLVITQHRDFHTQLKAVRAGAVGFFTKPVDLPALESRLEGCFNFRGRAPYRVLIVDDDAHLLRHHELVLRQSGMHVEAESDPARVLDHLQAFLPDVVVMDMHMPGCSGLELARIIRFRDEWLRVPIIYLSAETDLDRQMNAMAQAGDDFLTKPIADHALVAAVHSRAQRARVLSEALARDSLTGLLKHADIKEHVAVEVSRAVRTSKSACVAMIDLDHFKQVNDTHGHGAGDNVIRSMANLLRQRLRRTDLVGRYGGEEFVAIVVDCGAADAMKLLDGIRQHFATLTFMSREGSFHVSFSAGLAEIQGPESVESVLGRADEALYEAKLAGRNQVVLAAPLLA
ncbi:MAG: response regulator [Rubrivivax sp.]|nr:MAG: response regulator [Rubrivivax sp.]